MQQANKQMCVIGKLREKTRFLSAGCGGSEKSRVFVVTSGCHKGVGCLTTESVEGASLALEGIDHIHGGDSLPLGVLSVGDSVTDDVLQENLENTTGLLIDEARDSLHTTSAGQTTDGWLGDALDVVTQHLPVPLGATLSQTFASLAAARHLVVA